MDLQNNFGRKINTKLLLKSLVWNSIIQTFKEEKNKDITSYLKSIEVRGNVITIKTQNPLVNHELQMIENKLQEEIKKKLRLTGVSFQNFEIRYL